MSAKTGDQLLKPAEVAESIGIGLESVYAWIAERELRAMNIAMPGKAKPVWRIHSNDLAAFLAKRANTAAPQTVGSP